MNKRKSGFGSFHGRGSEGVPLIDSAKRSSFNSVLRGLTHQQSTAENTSWLSVRALVNIRFQKNHGDD